jgi:periplasmic copper chaperone A
MFKRNKYRPLVCSAALLGCLFIATTTSAHEYEIGKIRIEHPWLRTPKDGETSTRLYMHIENKGDVPDRLLGVKSEKVGGVKFIADPKYITVPNGVVLPAHSDMMIAPDKVPFITLEGITKMNPVGWGFELDLVFEKAGTVTIDAAVEAPDAAHAHDAEAMERWEKAHNPSAAATPAAEPHDAHSPDHGAMDHGAMTPATTPQPK